MSFFLQEKALAQFSSSKTCDGRDIQGHKNDREFFRGKLLLIYKILIIAMMLHN
jgi:hypothetical protein